MAEQPGVGEVDTVVAAALVLQAGKQKGWDTDGKLEKVDLDANVGYNLRLPLRHIEEQIRCLGPFADTLDSAHSLDFAYTLG